MNLEKNIERIADALEELVHLNRTSTGLPPRSKDVEPRPKTEQVETEEAENADPNTPTVSKGTTKGTFKVNGVVMTNKEIKDKIKELNVNLRGTKGAEKIANILAHALLNQLPETAYHKVEEPVAKTKQEETINLEDDSDDGLALFQDEEEKPKTKEITLEEVKVEASNFMNTHGESAAKTIFKKYGKKLSELSADRRAELYNELKNYKG